MYVFTHSNDFKANGLILGFSVEAERAFSIGRHSMNHTQQRMSVGTVVANPTTTNPTGGYIFIRYFLGKQKS
jgi:hypothetical protein